METDNNWLAIYAGVLEQLTPDSLTELEARLAENVEFFDPFNHCTDRQQMLRVMEDMYLRLDQVGFRVHQLLQQGEEGFLYWTFSGASKITGPFQFNGVSRIKSDPDGMILRHEDIWDASAVMQTLPILGRLITRLRNAWPVRLAERGRFCPCSVHLFCHAALCDSPALSTPQPHLRSARPDPELRCYINKLLAKYFLIINIILNKLYINYLFRLFLSGGHPESFPPDVVPTRSCRDCR